MKDLTTDENNNKLTTIQIIDNIRQTYYNEMDEIMFNNLHSLSTLHYCIRELDILSRQEFDCELRNKQLDNINKLKKHIRAYIRKAKRKLRLK